MKFTANLGHKRQLLWLAGATVIALGLRLVQLDDRPVHTDEAVNAVIVGDMLQGATYRYDPHDHHGPAYYYLTAPLCRLLGARSLADLEAWELRASAALVSGATILLLGLLLAEDRGAACGAAVFLTVGAPFVYYGRYAIHESLLVFGTLLALAGGWRFWRTGRIRWAALGGLGLGLAACTKESTPVTATAVVLALALGASHPTTRRQWRDGREPGLTGIRTLAGVLLAAGVAVALALALYSSLGRNPTGLASAIRAYGYLWVRAVSGAGHQKPWWTYLAWLAEPNPLCPPWFGWALLSGAIGGAAHAFLGRSTVPLIRFLAIFSAILIIIYSATPYKTPWLMLDFLAPAAAVAGYGLSSGLKALAASPLRAASVAAALLMAALFARESVRLCFRYADDPFNPLAYSPTSPDLARLAARLDRQAAHSPQGRNLLIQVVATDYWPLPWYLRSFPRVGYWSQLPDHLDGEVLLASPDEAGAVEARLGPGWHREFYGLRADVLIFLYTRDPADHA